MNNPFSLVPYTSNEYFCDREEETKTIVEYLLNGSNITLISPRRYGKTGLIYRVFDEMKQKKVDVSTCYVDIYATETLEDFIKVFSEAVIAALEKKKTVSIPAARAPSMSTVISSPIMRLSSAVAWALLSA